MTSRTLVLKLLLIIGLIPSVLIALMWLFNTAFMVQNWEYAVGRLHIYTGVAGGITLIALVIIYFLLLRPLSIIILGIEAGNTLNTDEYVKARRIIVQLPVFIIIVNAFGFFLGPVLSITITTVVEKTSFFTIQNMIVIFFSVTIGIFSALESIIFSTVVLSKPKEMLSIFSFEKMREKTGKDISLWTKNILVPLSILMMSCAIMGAGGYGILTMNQKNPLAIVEKIGDGRELTRQEKDYMTFMKNVVSYAEGNTGQGKLTEAAKKLETIHGGTQGEAVALLGLLFFVLLCMTLMLAITYAREQDTHLKLLNKSIKQLFASRGDLSKRLSIIHFDEIGELTGYINTLMEFLHTLLINIKNASDNVFSSSKILADFVIKIGAVSDNMSTTVLNVNENTKNEEAVVYKTKDVIEDLLKSAHMISGHVETQAAFIEESSSAMTEMASSIRSVSEVAQNAQKISSELRILAENGEKELNNTLKAIEDIDNAAGMVSGFAGIISRLAAQTNLLAMNAAIEAAHAGEKGRGFAVVADEVRKLAEESTKNAKQINTQIKQMNAYTEHGIALSESTKSALNKMNGYIRESSDITLSISEAMQEQNTGTAQILSAVSSLVTTTEEIKGLSFDQGKRSEDIRTLLEELVSATQTIKEAVAKQEDGRQELEVVTEQMREISERNMQVVTLFEESIGTFTM